jgi:hypothetical protein
MSALPSKSGHDGCLIFLFRKTSLIGLELYRPKMTAKLAAYGILSGVSSEDEARDCNDNK